MARRKRWRFVKSRQSYTIDELARNQKVSKGTVRRWRTDGLA
jgi:DeoR/GlpR family transcriptional regulator of sugar metabolism